MECWCAAYLQWNVQGKACLWALHGVKTASLWWYVVRTCWVSQGEKNGRCFEKWNARLSLWTFHFSKPPPPNTMRAHITPCKTPCNYTKTVGSNSIGKWVTFQNLGLHKCCTSLKITKHIIIVIKWMTFIQIGMLYWRYYTNFAGMLQITIFNESIFGKPCRWWNTHMFFVWLACTCLLFLGTIKECTWRKTPSMISYPTSTW